MRIYDPLTDLPTVADDLSLPAPDSRLDADSRNPSVLPNQFPLDPLATLMFPKVFPSGMKTAPEVSSEGRCHLVAGTVSGFTT
jgi:hypothetical protein